MTAMASTAAVTPPRGSGVIGAPPQNADNDSKPWSADLEAERLRLALDYEPSVFLWRIDPNQLSWIPVILSIIGVALAGIAAQIYWTCLVSLIVGCLMRKDSLKRAYAHKATSVARRELVPVAETLLALYPEALLAVNEQPLLEADRLAMISWARGHARRTHLTQYPERTAPS